MPLPPRRTTSFFRLFGAAVLVTAALAGAPPRLAAATSIDPVGTRAIMPALLPLPIAAVQQGSRPPQKTPARRTVPRDSRSAGSRGRATRPTRSRPSTLPALRHTSPSGEIDLAADLATLLSARVRSGTWGVVVTSLSRGDTLFSRNADTLLVPASTLKLYTAALAFDRLGPGHQFTTDILRTGTVTADGTLSGSLILRGGGDPGLSARYVGPTPDAPMRTLARLVADAGIRRVSGDVVGDASAFDARTIPEGWLSRYLHDSYATRVSALSLNGNLLNVVIAPAAAGRKGTITLQPATVAYGLVNETRTVAGVRTAKLTVSRRSDGTIVARGTIGSRSEPRVYQVVVEEPARFAAGAFRQALEQEGVVVDGDLRLDATPRDATRIASHASPPLWMLASAMNRESINHFAELLFRNVARTADPERVGSAEGANLLLQRFMTNRVGASAGAVYAADGSGLSTLDRATPRSLVQLLAYAHRAPWAREFHETLPVAGQSELLRHRMVGTPAAGNLHAKTGTTSAVIALGGYVTARNGELLAFSFIYNGTDRWFARETIDAMGATLAAFTR